jgi:phosphohistidine phosphatase
MARSRRLIVLRHAKSSWETHDGDHARPLNERGRRDAPRVAARLRAIGWTPERVLSSDATRTRETWQRMQPELGGGIAIAFHRELYLAGVDRARVALETLPDDIHCAMLLGHNPGWEEVVETFSGIDEVMGTCNAALLSLEAESWREAAQMDGCWKLCQVIRPKELG